MPITPSDALAAAHALDMAAETYLRRAILCRESGDLSGQAECVRQATEAENAAKRFRRHYSAAPIAAIH